MVAGQARQGDGVGAFVTVGGARAALTYTANQYEFVSLTGFRTSSFNQHIDLDDSNIAYAAINPENENTDTFTQEFRVSSDGGR